MSIRECWELGQAARAARAESKKEQANRRSSDRCVEKEDPGSDEEGEGEAAAAASHAATGRERDLPAAKKACVDFEVIKEAGPLKKRRYTGKE